MRFLFRLKVSSYFLTVLAVILVVVGATAFSAFEAHVVNVKAVVENALTVQTDSVEYGEVNYPLLAFGSDSQNTFRAISLSDSFQSNGRVDDVEYAIKLKPKVKEPCLEAPSTPVVTRFVKTAKAVVVPVPCDPFTQPTPGDPWAEVTVGDFTGYAWQYCEQYLPEDASTTDAVPYTVDLSDPYWQHCYLPLAGSLALLKNVSESTTSTASMPSMLPSDYLTVDTEVRAFHDPYLWSTTSSGTVSSLATSSIARGRLTKAGGDTVDQWGLFLLTPCFQGFCKTGADNPANAVDWSSLAYAPIYDYYVPPFSRLDPQTEHKVYGTDLWIEVTGISYATTSTSTPVTP